MRTWLCAAAVVIGCGDSDPGLPPVAHDDEVTIVNDDAPFGTHIDVRGNDIPGAVPGVRVIAVSQPAHGTTMISEGYEGVVFRPETGFAGTVSFTYTLSDQHGRDTATVTALVVLPHRAPIAKTDSAEIDDPYVTTIDVLANDELPNGGVITAITQPARAAATFTATDVTFMPPPGFAGGTELSYTVTDPAGYSSSATVRLAVFPVRKPSDIAVDSQGNVFIADFWHSRIRRIDSAGNVMTVAGTGVRGFGGDGGPATSAQLYFPMAIALDGAGNLYIADTFNSRVRRVDGNGIITSIAGTGNATFGGDGGPATSADLQGPTDVAFDASGRLLIADAWNYRIRRVDAGGTISTIAGTGSSYPSGDGGPATAATFVFPTDIIVDQDVVYVADVSGGCIRRIDSNGTITTFAGGGQTFDDGVAATETAVWLPSGLAIDPSGNLVYTDYGRVRRIDGSGIVTTIAGGSTLGFSGDGGPATAATLGAVPEGVFVDASGTIYIADTNNHAIRKIDAGMITTVVGGP